MGLARPLLLLLLLLLLGRIPGLGGEWFGLGDGGPEEGHVVVIGVKLHEEGFPEFDELIWGGAVSE